MSLSRTVNGASRLGDNPSDDICPVCKSNRYLNPSLQFLINPECYHKMCSTCVDRIFTSGPASCPVPHCGKTLRKKGFHKSFFENLQIEREVDIRRKVAAIYNKREDDFEDLLSYNNYLEVVESLVFDLVEGKGKVRQAAERRLEMYRLENMGKIEENQRVSAQEAETERNREKAQREAAKQRRIAAVKEEEDEKAEMALARREVLDRLANEDGNADEITEQAQKIILKKSSARRNLQQKSVGSDGIPREGLTIRGLKKRDAPAVAKPYDPFGGIDLAPTRYVLQSDYDNQWLAAIKRDENQHLTGGWSLQEYYSRAMFDAFSGLAVFIEGETVAKPEFAVSSPLATVTAAQASRGKVKIKTESDDVF
ncbi:CDK-activating kinase assembly factor MAT1-domain-containing protein [Bisporella sp. PMI_857]|nr:CDK-activating kinase assembly factor MAT1-domain-containing protein [Bisporella sp. PMI_857]